MSAVREFVCAMFARLSQASIRYCVLRNWESLPDHVGNDVDLWVDVEQRRAVEDLLRRLGHDLGWRLVQRWHWLGNEGDGLFVFVKP